MTGAVSQIVAWLNLAANAVGKVLLAPIALLPGWLSITCISAVLGAVCMIAFKYTSSQRAICRARNDIEANLLAVKLFPDSLFVTLSCHGRVLWGAMRLLVLAIVPSVVLIVPISLVLGQMALWYDARPLRVGEEAVITMTLNPTAGPSFPDARLETSSAAEVIAGPVRIFSKREICWGIRAREAGAHKLVFLVGGQSASKELTVGNGLMRTSVERPGWNWEDMIWQPAERPFGSDSSIAAIRIDYPPRESWVSGTSGWLIYCLAASMCFGFCFRPWLKVDW